MRDYSVEHRDVPEHQYAYDFDGVLRRYMMRSFGPFLTQGRALELGPYRGDFTEHLLKVFTDLTVVEAAPDLAEFVHNRFGSQVRCINATFETVNLDQKYDAIFLIHTLEHLDDPANVLRRISEWLSPTGRLYVAVPNANAPSRQIAVKMGLISHNSAVTEAEFKHGHRRTYTLDTLERDARLAGLEVMHRGGIFFKALANFQFDKLVGMDVISEGYLDGCYELGMQYPDLCASIYLVCTSGRASIKPGTAK